jgi:hypothetical protein
MSKSKKKPGKAKSKRESYDAQTARIVARYQKAMAEKEMDEKLLSFQLYHVLDLQAHCDALEIEIALLVEAISKFDKRLEGKGEEFLSTVAKTKQKLLQGELERCEAKHPRMAALMAQHHGDFIV